MSPLSDALIHAKLCEATYGPCGAVPPDCHDAGVRQLEWHDIQGTDTQFGIYLWGPFLLIIFRGTTDFHDWLTNLRIWAWSGGDLELEPQELPLGTSGIVAKGHPGYWKCWLSAEPYIRRALERYQHGLVELVGHSLGGAVAGNAALAIGSLGKEKVNLATFGAPRIFNAAGCLLLELCTERLRRYVDPRDPVPMHPWKCWGYEHHLGAIQLGSWWLGYAPIWMKRYHAIERYVAALE